MPIYTISCPKCGEIECLLKISDLNTLACPVCGGVKIKVLPNLVSFTMKDGTRGSRKESNRSERKSIDDVKYVDLHDERNNV